MAKTTIEWTDRTWNFLRGCSRISRGCGDSTGGGCYAEAIARRFSGAGLPYEGTISERGKWNGNITFHEDKLLEALRWKKPQRVFVNSMSDLFHENVKDEWIDKAFAVMALTPHLTYQILTKRPERALEWFTNRGTWPLLTMIESLMMKDERYNSGRQSRARFARKVGNVELAEIDWPLPNVWLGVSVEDQKTADERIPLLLQTPAAVRFLSVEPLLSRVDLKFHLGIDSNHDDLKGLVNWVIVGTESGPNRRVAKLEWIESIVEQCQAAGTPAFVKQIELNGKVEKDIDKFPKHLQIREFPEVKK